VAVSFSITTSAPKRAPTLMSATPRLEPEEEEQAAGGVRQVRQPALEVAVLALLPRDQVPLGRGEVALARVRDLLPVVRRVLLRAIGEDLDDLAD
jgi:hypothetical protein